MYDPLPRTCIQGFIPNLNGMRADQVGETIQPAPDQRQICLIIEGIAVQIAALHFHISLGLQMILQSFPDKIEPGLIPVALQEILTHLKFRFASELHAFLVLHGLYKFAEILYLVQPVFSNIESGGKHPVLQLQTGFHRKLLRRADSGIPGIPGLFRPGAALCVLIREHRQKVFGAIAGCVSEIVFLQIIFHHQQSGDFMNTEFCRILQRKTEPIPAIPVFTL